MFVAHVSSVQAVLSLVSTHGVVKKPQAEVALEYLAGERSTPEHYAQVIAQAKETVDSVPIDAARLTIPYVAGLFSAEGPVGLYRNSSKSFSLQASITQNSCPRLLHAIRETLGYGRVFRGQLLFGATLAPKFFASLLPWIRKSQKRRQIKVAQQYLAYAASLGKGSTPRSSEERKKIERYARKLEKLKKR